MYFKNIKKLIILAKKLIILHFLIFLLLTSFASKIELRGIYKGENIFVENHFAYPESHSCVTKVLVNNIETSDEINSAFFEVDLSIYNFKIGDFIVVTIMYKDNCVPKIINPDALKPSSSFQIQEIKINDKGLLIWSTINERGSLPFVIEQFRWNKWIKIGTIKGNGTSKLNKYSYKIDFHVGKNRFRVKQFDSNGKPKYSIVAEYINNSSPVTFIPGNGNSTEKMIYFSTDTRFEIFDYYGKFVKDGFYNQIDVSSLKKGLYFLNYDNKTDIFKKK